MKFLDIINNDSFQSITSILRIPLRNVAWRNEHRDVPAQTLWSGLVDLPGGPTHGDWLSRWTALQVALTEADPNLTITETDLTWLLSWMDHEPETEAVAVMAMLYAYAMAPDETMTPAEAAEATGTSESSWRNRAAAGQFPGSVKAGKQWLIPVRYVR